MTFDESYFTNHYGDYARQNPTRKLEWYVDQAVPWIDAEPIRHLDVGCGLGAFAAHTARSPRFVTYGTDISPFAIARAQQVAPSATLAVASAETRLWPDDSFDLVSALDVLEHLPEPGAALEAAHAMLAPDGILLAVMPVYDGLSGPIIRRLDSDPTHLHKWGRGDWLDLIGKHFEVLNWLGAFRLLLPRGPYLHFPTKVLRTQAPTILVVGRRKR
jgi:SAM-dependent methyltransferase